MQKEGRQVDKVQYDSLHNLNSWIDMANNIMRNGQLCFVNQNDIHNISGYIQQISDFIRHDYSFYAEVLPAIFEQLFIQGSFGMCSVNPAAFGELYIIIKHLLSEPSRAMFWTNIHPRIIAISYNLFCDGYYDSAAEKAIRELETQLRELFAKLKPNNTVPVKVVDIIGALLSENGVYHFCDVSTVSGKNLAKGIKLLFEGSFSAYRNPAAHQNISISKRESLEQIMLASQLMYVLEKEPLD